MNNKEFIAELSRRSGFTLKDTFPWACLVIFWIWLGKLLH